MSLFRLLAIGVTIVWLTFFVRALFAQKVEATVLYRQNSDTSYRAMIPKPDGSRPEGVIDCAAEVANAVCENPVPDTTTGQPSLNVTGTTVSLLLPDGRVAIVNCLNKYSFKGNYVNRRSCAMPMVSRVQADLDGKNAKLRWSPVADNPKAETETYHIVALLNQP